MPIEPYNTTITAPGYYAENIGSGGPAGSAGSGVAIRYESTLGASPIGATAVQYLGTTAADLKANIDNALQDIGAGGLLEVTPTGVDSLVNGAISNTQRFAFIPWTTVNAAQPHESYGVYGSVLGNQAAGQLSAGLNAPVQAAASGITSAIGSITSAAGIFALLGNLSLWKGLGLVLAGGLILVLVGRKLL